MTGFTYGASSGATYGEASGATWGLADDGVWLLDGAPIGGLVSERRTWQTLEATWHVDTDTRDTQLAPLQATAGKLETLTLGDGSFTTLDRALDDGVHTLTPPADRIPPRTEREYVVDAYDQRPLDQRVAAHEATVTFVALENREPAGPAGAQARASDEWGLQLRSGTVATTRVQADVTEGTEASAPTVSLTLVCTPGETKIIEESLTRLAAVSVAEVPDGENTASDGSAGNANSVLVTTPDGTDPIPEGEYAVLDWQTELLSTRAYRVAVTISPTDLARSGLGWGRLGHVQLGAF